MKTRRVKVFKWFRPEGETKYIKVEDCYATFHQFGMDYEEFTDGPGPFSTAIVEYSDGTVGNVPVEMIQFVED